MMKTDWRVSLQDIKVMAAEDVGKNFRTKLSISVSVAGPGETARWLNENASDVRYEKI